MKTLFLILLALPLLALAGPGAHGPNGEHLDAPAQQASVSSRPRAEAATDVFELVATLHASELSILIDRFASNEPVLNARLQVESGGRKAAARFRAEHGDYAVDDPKLLQLLQQPGEHALVFTLLAGEDSDLLDAQLRVEAHEPGPAHSHALEYAAYAAYSAAGLLALGALIWLGRRGAPAFKGAR